MLSRYGFTRRISRFLYTLGRVSGEWVFAMVVLVGCSIITCFFYVLKYSLLV